MTSLTSENALLDAALENPEIRGFAMFTMNVEFTDPQGKVYATPLWKVRPNPPVDETPQEREEAARARRQRVQVMANRVEAGLTPDGRGWEPTESEDREYRLGELFRI